MRGGGGCDDEACCCWRCSLRRFRIKGMHIGDLSSVNGGAMMFDAFFLL